MSARLSENSSLPEYSKKEILEELQKILSSDSFSRTTVLSNFLKFIVEETLEGNTEGLKEYTIAVNALGKPSNFNPQIDAIVRIHAGRLRRLLNDYYHASGLTDPIKIEVVKGTYVPVFRAHLIPTPKAQIAEKDEIMPHSRSKLTLAVLPFRNLCQGGDYQFFVDGLGEEMTRAFSKYQDIAVIGHHSTRKYAAEPEDIRVIGSDLGAHYVITGSVKRSSTKIGVNVALVKTLNGMQVWSQSYNKPLNIDSLMDIQDEIIKNVCSVLGGYYGFIIHDKSISHEETVTSMDSFDAALWNYYFQMNFSEKTYLQTRHALEEALDHDPNFAMGLAMLSELYLNAYALGYPTVDNPINEAYTLSKKAIKIDPQCQHAYQQYAWALLYLKRKEASLQALEKSIALNPSSVSAMGAAGFILACLGDYKRAKAMLTQSLDLNPHCPWWFYLGFFFIYYHEKQYEKALEYAKKIETLDIFYEPLTKALAKTQLGLHKEAQLDVNILKKRHPLIVANLEASLSTALFDRSLVDKLLKGAKKLGLSMVGFLSLETVTEIFKITLSVG